MTDRAAGTRQIASMIARVSGMCFLGSDPVAIASIRKSGPTDKLSRLRAASSQTSDAVWFCDRTYDRFVKVCANKGDRVARVAGYEGHRGPPSRQRQG